jgi:chromodomain-helicase-DNA-binding protein 1
VQDDWPRALNRKDAVAFVRAVKRYGLESRLPDVAAEVGPSLLQAPEPAQ